MMEKNAANLPADMAADLQRLVPSPELLTKALAELVRLNSLFVQVLSGLPLRLLLVDCNSGNDEQRRVLAASRLCLEEVLQAGREEVLEQPLHLVLGAAAADLAGLEAALDAGRPWRGELRGHRVRVQPLSTYGQQAALLIFENAPDKPAELARTEQEARLVQMGQLSGGVAHELKNILQNVGGILQILQLKYLQENYLQQNLGLVLGELEEAAGLLGGFLRLSRLEAQVGEGELNQVVREALLLVYGSCHINRIQVTEELADELPRVYMDKGRLKQVIINCLDNSREAILAKRDKSGAEAAGHIRIGTRFEPGLEQLVLTIADDGIGLGPEEAANFFKPFFTTKATGTGMGTSISAAIVRLHGGEMEASGEPGAGCCVTVRLPLHNGLAADRQDLYDELAEFAEMNM